MPKDDNSLILNKYRRRGKNVHTSAKEVEASTGGTSLPLGLEGASAQITRAKMGENKNGNPYFYIYATVLEPEQYKGAFCGQIYNLTEDKYNTEEDQIKNLYSRCLKHLGFDHIIETAGDQFEVLEKVLPILNRGDMAFTFDTGNRPRKDGSATVFIRGLSDNGMVPAEEADTEADTEDDAPFAIGQAVTVMWGDDEYKGHIVLNHCEDEQSTIAYEDGDEDLCPWTEITVGEEEVEDEDEEEDESLHDKDDVTGEGEGDTSEEEEEEEVPFEPTKGDVLVHTGLKGQPQVEVLQVFKRRQTCKVKKVGGGTLKREVEWSKLEIA
jgi:hypothetical protein